MSRLLALALIWLACTAAAPVKLITDISQSRIDIIYTFKGAELLVFGAIQYANGQVPDEPPGLAVVMRGPAEPVTVRKKARVAGIWVNTRSARFESAPGFYAVATSKPIAKLVDQRTATIWEIGVDSLQLSPTGNATPAETEEFEHGLIDLRRRNRLAEIDRELPHQPDHALEQAGCHEQRFAIGMRLFFMFHDLLPKSRHGIAAVGGEAVQHGMVGHVAFGLICHEPEKQMQGLRHRFAHCLLAPGHRCERGQFAHIAMQGVDDRADVLVAALQQQQGGYLRADGMTAHRLADEVRDVAGEAQRKPSPRVVVQACIILRFAMPHGVKRGRQERDELRLFAACEDEGGPGIF